MINPEIIGGIAAFLTTTAYAPQAIKAIREKNTKSLSLTMYMMMSAGIAAWFIYGVMLESPALMLANGITFMLVAAILYMKIRHG